MGLITRCAASAALLAISATTLHAQAQLRIADATARPHAEELHSTPPSSSPDHDHLAPRAKAVRLQGVIQLDGKLDDAAWQSAPVVAGLHQTQPNDGAAASLKTEVRVMYDDEFIYVAARMFDDQPDHIVKRLARRDAETGSDMILIQFDPYHNHNGDASFSLTPGGSRWDGGNGDVSWDPVWEGKTHIDSIGWTAEMKIPFSQLRFRPGSTEAWGFQVQRFVNRLNEEDMWSYWKRNEQGGPARWGHIDGIAAPAKVPGRLEVLPYVVSQAQLHDNVEAGNPFAHRREGTMRAGADLKYQVTSTLTLSATLNPDFGQAEVDPAVVNLTAFETFFDEKREFFIEGRDKFRFGGLWCFTCSNASSLSMLFTRRIGRPPQAANLAYDEGDYADVPDATTILGAAKLTGRTRSGWNIGVLNAVTARENADVRAGLDHLRQEVEPATNYFVSRMSRDLLSGNLRIGGIATSVYRGFNDPKLATQLNHHSEGVGLDAEYWWANRTYHLLAQTAMTNISGDPLAILRAQRSSARYFQRPDRGNGSNSLFSDQYDSTLTSMRGYGSYVRVAREGGNWRWESSLNVRSPGFENNDIAALSRADYIWMHGNINRRWTKPTKYYRSANVTLGGQQQYNYDGDMTARQLHLSSHLETTSYWGIGLYGTLKPQVLDDRATRGGPVVAQPAQRYLSMNFTSDQRHPFWFQLYGGASREADGGGMRSYSVSATWQPATNVSLSVGPEVENTNGKAQYITAVDDATATSFYGRRYVFSDLHGKTISMDTRLNVTFTPTMSLQLFAQPYISSNRFTNYKEFARPRAVDKVVYGRDVGTVTANGNNGVTIDPDGSGPAQSFDINNRDFTFRSLRGNAVFRWEYKPGSTLFLVWTQDRSSDVENGDFDFNRDRHALFNSPAHHVFLVKLNYWLPM